MRFRSDLAVEDMLLAPVRERSHQHRVIYIGEQMAQKPEFGKDVRFIHSDTVGDACTSLDLHANETRTSRT